MEANDPMYEQLDNRVRVLEEQVMQLASKVESHSSTLSTILGHIGYLRQSWDKLRLAIRAL